MLLYRGHILTLLARRGVNAQEVPTPESPSPKKTPSKKRQFVLEMSDSEDEELEALYVFQSIMINVSVSLLHRESPVKRLRLESPAKALNAPSTPPPRGRTMRNGQIKDINPFAPEDRSKSPSKYV